MGSDHNIYLVRHGQSLGNVDEDVYKNNADHSIPLSDLGFEQASSAAQFLVGRLQKYRGALCGIDLWHSPYLRAVQTSSTVEHWLRMGGFSVSNKQAFWLAERQFGLFDGINKDLLPSVYPNEWEHYNKCVSSGGKFWARMPMGESPFDVSVRLHQFINTLRRDLEMNDPGRDVVVVAHSTVITLFRMLVLHKDVSWFEDQSGPNNCEVIHMSGGAYNLTDHGAIFGGFDV